jgi:hypothetical protein
MINGLDVENQGFKSDFYSDAIVRWCRLFIKQRHALNFFFQYFENNAFYMYGGNGFLAL